MDILKQTLSQTLKQTANVLTAGFITAGVAIYVTSPAIANQKMTLTPGFSPDPQVMTGTSGGTRETADCGYVKPTDTPDYVVTLTAPFNFLRASVQADGDVTMLVEGPNGRICSDDVNGLMPEISGAAAVGTYSIWIGDYVGNVDQGFNYQLTITTQQDGSAEPGQTRLSDRTPPAPRSTPAARSNQTDRQSAITSSPPPLTAPPTATQTTQQDKQFKPTAHSWLGN